MLEKLNELVRSITGDALGYVVLAAAAIVVLWIVWRLIRRRKRVPPPLAPDLKVDVMGLGDHGPPEGPPVLEFYNLPMRLAAVVLAPVGRGRQLPPDEAFLPLLEAIVPGLDKVAAFHRPLVRRWPSQVSARGFAHLFFNNARLPGTAGKGTPWCSVAGLFKAGNRPIMAGLVLCAAGPNSLGQTIIDSEYQWLGCLRVKRRAD